MPDEPTRATRAAALARSAAAAARRIDGGAGALRLARAARRRLPGDARYGDPLSVAGDEAPEVLGRQLALIAAERPSALRELGFGALQVWQSLSEAQGRGRGDREVAILFTDLVGFSSWALQAGDDAAIALLRAVARVDAAAVRAHGGTVVKRLGDGLMATFDSADDAVAAARAIHDELAHVEVQGHRPQLRAGVHVGTPRRIGGDWFGVDVNVAARVAAAAGPGETLVSDAALERLERAAVTSRRWRFRAKGAPRDLSVHRVELPA
ncbi:MAG TPA: adenylate/guanylate cyclase domain-containing protein [Solirubrobacteraceae bacterium]|nr:adenylate/guanylate cyclase domain-containing protein [Solirubrobacteraceae bacterium]